MFKLKRKDAPDPLDLAAQYLAPRPIRTSICALANAAVFIFLLMCNEIVAAILYIALALFLTARSEMLRHTAGANLMAWHHARENERQLRRLNAQVADFLSRVEPHE